MLEDNLYGLNDDPDKLFEELNEKRAEIDRLNAQGNRTFSILTKVRDILARMYEEDYNNRAINLPTNNQLQTAMNFHEKEVVKYKDSLNMLNSQITDLQKECFELETRLNVLQSTTIEEF